MKYLQTRPNCAGCTKCQRHCPVKAIYMKDNVAVISEEYCIVCGECISVCPQNSMLYISDFNKVKGWLESGRKVVLSINPAYYGAWGDFTGRQMLTACRAAGFAAVHETAEAANAIIDEVAQFAQTSAMDTIITTCCPSINRMIQIYYPDLIRYMAPVASPITAHGRYLKALYGEDTLVVYAGPCYAQKGDAMDTQNDGVIDAVLTFKELHRFVNQMEQHVTDMKGSYPDGMLAGISMLYATSGGIGTALRAHPGFPDHEYNCIHMSGTENCRKILDEIRKGFYNRCVIELDACPGGCVNGPARPKGSSGTKNDLFLEKDFLDAPFRQENALEFLKYAHVGKEYVSEAPVFTEPGEEEIQSVLISIGRNTKLKELDCGGCGYHTCRENARAICLGYSDKNSCIQHLHEEASSLANLVLQAVPTMILVLDKELKIREISASCAHLFKGQRSTILGNNIADYLDDTDFDRIRDLKYDLHNKEVELPQYGRTVMMNVLYLKENESQLVMMEDITEQKRKDRANLEEKMKIADTAQAVIDKQMQVAQTIAGLLGESTAETKVVLNKMIHSFLDEGGK